MFTGANFDLGLTFCKKLKKSFASTSKSCGNETLKFIRNKLRLIDGAYKIGIFLPKFKYQINKLRKKKQAKNDVKEKTKCKISDVFIYLYTNISLTRWHDYFYCFYFAQRLCSYLSSICFLKKKSRQKDRNNLCNNSKTV